VAEMVQTLWMGFVMILIMWWPLGLSLHLVSGLIHILLVAALVVVIIKRTSGSRELV